MKHMVENPVETAPKIPRRALLTTCVKALGAVAAGTLVGREIRLIEKGIDTPSGIFFPLYERHDQGINVDDLPPKLDGFFKEVGQLEGELIYRSEPGWLLNVNVQQDKPGIKEEVLKKLSQDGTKILFGDVSVGDEDGNDGMKKALARLMAAAIVVGSGYLYQSLREAMGEWNPSKDQSIHRREFLKNTLRGISAVFTVPVVTELATVGLFSTGMGVEQKNAIQRIYLRLSGIVGNLQPEDHLIFFRNVIMADKLLTAAESLKRETGRKPRIAFNVGAGHAGMEDFLVAGHSFNQWLISKYPNDVLQKIIEIAGSIEDFCSVRALTLPKELGLLDQLVSDELIVDEGLVQMLKTKLAPS